MSLSKEARKTLSSMFASTIHEFLQVYSAERFIILLEDTKP